MNRPALPAPTNSTPRIYNNCDKREGMKAIYKIIKYSEILEGQLTKLLKYSIVKHPIEEIKAATEKKNINANGSIDGLFLNPRVNPA